MSKNPLDTIARWKPPAENVPIGPRPPKGTAKANRKVSKLEADEFAETEARKRKPIGDRQRFRILHRFRHTCVYCGAKAGDPLPDGTGVVKVEVDHIKSVKDGGDNRDENLTVACGRCNRGKSGKSV